MSVICISSIFHLMCVCVWQDLNFRYEWNNFLHQNVEQSIACILSASPPLPSDGTEQQTPALVVEVCVICDFVNIACM